MSGHRTLTLEEAARFLHMSPAVLRRRAKTGRVRAAKPGKQWVFLESDLADYLRALYSGHGQASSSGISKEQCLCHSADVELSGGSGSRHPTENAYADLLRLPTAPGRRNTTTG